MEFEESKKAMSKALSERDMEEFRRVSSEAVAASGDTFELIQLTSIIAVAGQSDLASEAADKASSLVGDDPKNRAEAAGALRALGFPLAAYRILKGMEGGDSIHRITATCLVDMEEYESALDEFVQIQEPTVYDRIMLSRIYSYMGEHAKAIELAELIEKENPNLYDAMVRYVDSLMMAGKQKEAIRYARERLKAKDADGNAIAAYVMRISGKEKSAAGYAMRAINIDQKHIGAMETLGICLAQKGEAEKARIVAGAINEISPGHKSAMEIIHYLERSHLELLRELGPLSCAVAEPDLLPELRADERQRDDDLQTTQPHQDHEYCLDGRR